MKIVTGSNEFEKLGLEPWMTCKQVMKYWNCCRATVYKRLGKRKMYPVPEVKAFLSKSEGNFQSTPSRSKPIFENQKDWISNRIALIKARQMEGWE